MDDQDQEQGHDQADRGGESGGGRLRLRWCPKRFVPERLRPRGSDLSKECPKKEVEEEEEEKWSSEWLKGLAVPEVTTRGIRYMRLLTPDLDAVVGDTDLCTSIMSGLSRHAHFSRTTLNSEGAGVGKGQTPSRVSWRMSTSDYHPYRQASGSTGTHRLRITDGAESKKSDESDAAVRDLLKDYNDRERKPRPPRLFIRDDPFTTGPASTSTPVLAVSGWDSSLRRGSEPQQRLITRVSSEDPPRRGSEPQRRGVVAASAAVENGVPRTPVRDRGIVDTSRLPRYSSLSTTKSKSSSPSQQKSKGRRRTSRDVGGRRPSGSKTSPGTKPPPAPLRLPFSPSSPIVVSPPPPPRIPSPPGPAPTKPLPAPPTEIIMRRNRNGPGIPIRRTRQSRRVVLQSQTDMSGKMGESDPVTPPTPTRPPPPSPVDAEAISPKNTNGIRRTSLEELLEERERRKTWVHQKKVEDLQLQGRNGSISSQSQPDDNRPMSEDKTPVRSPTKAMVRVGGAGSTGHSTSLSPAKKEQDNTPPGRTSETTLSSTPRQDHPPISATGPCKRGTLLPPIKISSSTLPNNGRTATASGSTISPTTVVPTTEIEARLAKVEQDLKRILDRGVDRGQPQLHDHPSQIPQQQEEQQMVRMRCGQQLLSLSNFLSDRGGGDDEQAEVHGKDKERQGFRL